jgi:exodeoxyribonuclease V gamma subunit
MSRDHFSGPASAGLFVHRSNRLDRLASALVDRLAASLPDDPIAPFTVVVGSRGMERWLRHRIAQASGICANVDFLFPSVAIRQASEALRGDAEAEAEVGEQADDPWSPDALAFAVLAALPSLLDDPAFEPVRRYLGDSAPPARDAGAASTRGGIDRRAYGLAREIADLVDRYVHYRRDWLEVWRRGEQPAPLAEEPGAAWQRRLFCELEARLGQHHGAAALARLEAASQQASVTASARAGGALHVFGVSSMPPTHLEALAALARTRRVELYLLSPSELYWGDLRTLAQARRALRTAAREDVAEAIRDGLARQNPLLTTLGRLSRDQQLLLEELPGGYREDGVSLFVDPRDEAALGADGAHGAGDGPIAPPAPTMLARLQADVLALSSPAELRADALEFAARAPHDGDASIRVHACHGPTRQVEVLRDELLALFDAQPALQPRDVVVMTPDLATFAPLVASIFGEGRDRPSDRDAGGAWGAVGAPRIPVEIADLGVRQKNPVADVLLRVLELAESRVTASGVVDLLALEPVRLRFELSSDALATILGWVRDSGIRWGVDEADRARFDLPAERGYTFAFGLDRLALGVVMSDDDELFAGVAPVDAMEGDRPELFGRFAELCATLFHQLEALRPARTLPDWGVALRAAIDALTRTSPKAAFLREEIFDELASIERQAAAAGFGDALTLSALRALLAGRFESPRGGDRPIGGAVSVCALSPMRSVPFRVVCLLGMDQDAFPRAARGVGFDLTRVAPRVGDREPRDEDRHLLLEAILSARDHLIVAYSGHDPNDNESLPPAVPIAELLDVLDASFPARGAPDGHAARSGSVRDAIVAHHSLQPFSPARFDAARPASHDRRMLRAAQALLGPRGGSLELFRDGALPDAAPANGLHEARESRVDVDALAACLRQPVKALLEKRLRLQLRSDAIGLEDREPLERSGGLGRWSLGDDLLSWALRQRGQGVGTHALDWARARALLDGRAELPVGAAGRLAFQDAQAKVGAALVGAEASLARPRELVEIAHTCARTSRRVGGVVRGTFRGDGEGELFELVSDEPDKPKHLLRAWVRVLALAATFPALRWSARIAGVEAAKGASGATGGFAPKAVVLTAPADAAAILDELVEIEREAMRAPILLFEKTSRAYFKALAKADAPTAEQRRAALTKAQVEWEGAAQRAGEGEQPHFVATFRGATPFVLPTGDPAPEFDALAMRLWRPIAAATSVEEGAR